MQYKYCPLCGKKLVIKYCWDEGGVPFCETHKELFFNLPKPCIMIGVVKENHILLLKQSYIFKNSKVLLTGYVGIDETAEEAAIREVKEESGLNINGIKYLGSDYVEGKEILMLTYMAFYESGEIVKSDEVEDMGWVKLDEALSVMQEDIVGKKVVEKILKYLKNN